MNALYVELKYWVELILIKFIGENGISLAVLASVFIFRNPITEFLSRLVRIGPQGAEAIAPLQQAPISTSTEVTRARVAIPVPDADLKPIVDSVEKLLESRDSDEEKIKFLVWATATTIRNVGFERGLRITFGTQFALLKALNTAIALNQSAAIPFFQEYVEKCKKIGIEARNFEQWLRYLTVSLYVEKDGDTLKLTERGKQFLQYQVSQSQPEPGTL